MASDEEGKKVHLKCFFPSRMKTINLHVTANITVHDILEKMCEEIKIPPKNADYLNLHVSALGVVPKVLPHAIFLIPYLQDNDIQPSHAIIRALHITYTKYPVNKCKLD